MLEDRRCRLFDGCFLVFPAALLVSGEVQQCNRREVLYTPIELLNRSNIVLNSVAFVSFKDNPRDFHFFDKPCVFDSVPPSDFRSKKILERQLWAE